MRANATVGTDVAPNNWFFSHDYGNVHFVSIISTDILFVSAAK